jgi:stalled ribosome alternative rescue factor ArfA
MFFEKAFDIQAGFDYIKSMKNARTHKAKDAKRRNPIARVLRENKLFTSRVIRDKVSYNRKPKHRKDESNGYD